MCLCPSVSPASSRATTWRWLWAHVCGMSEVGRAGQHHGPQPPSSCGLLSRRPPRGRDQLLVISGIPSARSPQPPALGRCSVNIWSFLCAAPRPGLSGSHLVKEMGQRTFRPAGARKGGRTTGTANSVLVKRHRRPRGGQVWEPSLWVEVVSRGHDSPACTTHRPDARPGSHLSTGLKVFF